MIQIQDPTACSGCGACAAICPRQAISMRENAEGFLYPAVNIDVCVGCDLCDKICPVRQRQLQGEGAVEAPLPQAFAARNTDLSERLASSSGGIFALLAGSVLDAGGVVCGAAFSVDYRAVRHIFIDKKSELSRLMGSKYLQSDVGDAYPRVKEFLAAGREVLFVGTPCQTAGLFAYLDEKPEKLYTCDLVCHGVPSPRVWEKYVAEREARAGSAVRRVSFRDKSYGWRRYSLKMEFTNGKVYCKRHPLDPYMRAFLQNASLRESCAACAFKSLDRCADVTLADFWGVERVSPEHDDDRGTSLLLVHSEKGRELLEKAAMGLRLHEVSLGKAVAYNAALTKSMLQSEKRTAFFTAAKKSVIRAAADLFPVSFSEKCRSAALDTRLGAFLKKRRQRKP